MYYLNTPLFLSHRLNRSEAFKVFYKMDCFQPTGSFKIRGMEVLLRDLRQKGHREVICSSGGNAGYSLAYVGQQLGVKVKVFVPQTTSKYMIDKISLLDAEVSVFGASWDEAHQEALALSESLNLPYIPPFDHPLLWQGHSTIIDECAAVMKSPDRLVVAVGGGGLLCGIFEGMVRNGWHNTKVVTAETDGASSFAQSFNAGRNMELSSIDTIATSLGARRVAEKSLEYAKQFDVETYVTEDRKAFFATSQFFSDFNVLVEPACGAALSYPMEKKDFIQPNENILVIACGGVNMSWETFLSYHQKFV